MIWAGGVVLLWCDGAHQVVACPVLERMEGEAPLGCGHRVARLVEQHHILPKHLSQIEGPHCRNLKRHIVYEYS